MSSVWNSILNAIPPINKAGHPFIAIAVVAALVFFLLWEPLGWLGVIATLYVAYFFRDPDRVTPHDARAVISSADGRVTAVGHAVPPAELNLGDMPRLRISVFLSVFDVHVNRAPVTGTITRIAYRPGKFFNAELDKASEHNERNGIVIETPANGPVAMVQIAGLVARRIVCQVRERQDISAGTRVGLIRFGSRVDVYLPQGSEPVVLEGQIAVAGETVLARLPAVGVLL